MPNLCFSNNPKALKWNLSLHSFFLLVSLAVLHLVAGWKSRPPCEFITHTRAHPESRFSRSMSLTHLRVNSIHVVLPVHVHLYKKQQWPTSWTDTSCLRVEWGLPFLSLHSHKWGLAAVTQLWPQLQETRVCVCVHMLCLWVHVFVRVCSQRQTDVLWLEITPVEIPAQWRHWRSSSQFILISH